ncbi:DUF1173 family protein [Methylibium rhizosphaerae]|uniref:DUF1173 family protein n=1 Tax=Methylibium rhizosphaerae TaxID=2570323 RepID=UPI00112D2E30|nr:DUF1173 family protein [Methylibium rhizosphaerae]
MWQTTDQGTAVTCPDGTYLIGGRRYQPNDPGFSEVIAEAHARRQRPRCLCQPQGLEMYVARLDGGYIVKRMPETGSRHAKDCPSYELPPELSPYGNLIGTAIKEDPETGKTALRLAFALSKAPGQARQPQPGEPGPSVKADGSRLTLKGLLLYLWDQAGLNFWKPSFEGKRNWATVRNRLLQTARHKTVAGEDLASRLYIPEPFSVDKRDEIEERRRIHWAAASTTHNGARRLLLLIGEVKEIAPARFGYKAVVKHLPGHHFSLAEELYRRLGRRFASELASWGTDEQLRLILIGTVSRGEGGPTKLHEISLAPMAANWTLSEKAIGSRKHDDGTSLGRQTAPTRK